MVFRETSEVCVHVKSGRHPVRPLRAASTMNPSPSQMVGHVATGAPLSSLPRNFGLHQRRPPLGTLVPSAPQSIAPRQVEPFFALNHGEGPRHEGQDMGALPFWELAYYEHHPAPRRSDAYPLTPDELSTRVIAGPSMANPSLGARENGLMPSRQKPTGQALTARPAPLSTTYSTLTNGASPVHQHRPHKAATLTVHSNDDSDVYVFKGTPVRPIKPARPRDVSERASQARPGSSGGFAKPSAKRRRPLVVEDIIDAGTAAISNPETTTPTTNLAASLRGGSREPSVAVTMETAPGTSASTTPRRPLQGRTERSVDARRIVGDDDFDRLIYGQEGAATPPPRRAPIHAETFNANGTGSARSPQVKGEDTRLYLSVDPRVHWNHNKPQEWYDKRMEEIRHRGGRKANFGKAASRMRSKRREEALVRSVTSFGQMDNEPGSERFGRPMDFCDVPEADLPDMVSSNPAWMKAVSWMRECREKSVERRKQIAQLQKQGRPWKHLLGPSDS